MLYYTGFRAMGNTTQVWLETDHDGAAILKQVSGWFEEIEAVLSRFRPQSELSQLNARSGEWVVVSDILLSAVLAACHAAEITEGLYNPLVLPALLGIGYTQSFETLEHDQVTATAWQGAIPAWDSIEVDLDKSSIRLPHSSAIDLGGIGKGWAAERIARRLKTYGPCLVDAGGDLVACGAPYGEQGWTIQIADPLDDNRNILPIRVVDSAVTTSGTTYRRWLQNGQRRHHLIDPRTGQPARTDILSVTVVHPHAPTAEAYTKAVLLLGSAEGLAWLNQQPYTAGMVVCEDGTLLATSSLVSGGKS